MKHIGVIAGCVWALTACLGASAQTPPATAAASDAPSFPSAHRSTLASAEVISVYPKDKRVLLRHGPMASLGMSAMTMEFAVPQRRMLRVLKPGRQVRFSAAQVNGDYVLTHVEAAR